MLSSELLLLEDEQNVEDEHEILSRLVDLMYDFVDNDVTHYIIKLMWNIFSINNNFPRRQKEQYDGKYLLGFFIEY